MWNDLGSLPVEDELEVTIMGSGFGESIVVHIGAGIWLVVDSCKYPIAGGAHLISAPLYYFQKMGVNVASNVAAVVATHWDSDHIGEIGSLVDACKSAKFICANALLQKVFLQYKERLMTGSAVTKGARIQEFSRVLEICAANKKSIKYASIGRELMVWPESVLPLNRRCTLRSLSPSDKEYTLFLSEILADMPIMGDSKRSAASRTPNLTSVVLHIDWGHGTSVLLGADMEAHHDKERGWCSVIEGATELFLSKAEVYKVSHHGSENGHDDQVWNKLLVPTPLAMLTPYLRGKYESCPPTRDGVIRITNLAPQSFITTQRKQNKISSRSPAINNGLKDLGIVMNSKPRSIGIVRFRKRLGQDIVWRQELFGPACPLNQHFN